MPGLFDFLQGVMGRPDPQQQLAASLGQGPGQPGSPQGPQPLAGQNGPPGGPAGPGGSPDPSGGPSPPQAPPQPAVYQSPPDLAQMYLALQQRDQARQQFNSGLGLLAASMYPGRHPEMIMKAMTGGGEDAGSLFGNLVQLQQYQQQNQALQAYRQALPGMLDKAGLDQSLAPVFAANPSLFGDVLKSQMGLTGTQTDKEYKQQVLQFQKANPGQPLPPDLQSEGAWDQSQREAITTRDTAAKTKTADLIADQHNFGNALGNYDNMIKDSEALLKEPGLDNIVGGTGQFNQAGNPLNSPETTKALALYNKIMAGQYAAGVQDFKGAGRITQTELKTDAPSQSVMGSRNLDPVAFRQGVQEYIDKLKQKRANLFGVAQKADDPRLSDDDYAKYVAPNQDLYGGPKRNIPDFSKMSAADADAAYEKIPSGKVFIDTDGQAKKKP